VNQQGVSVVVPCFNAARHVEEAVASVAASGPVVREIVLVDDGSTDDGAARAGRIDPRVRVVRQENRGISAARNRGVAECTSELVAFLDADDRWPHGSLETRLSRLHSDAALGYVSGLTRQFLSPELSAAERAAFECPPDAQPGRLAGTLVIRRSVWERVGVFDEELRVGETIDWLFRADAAGIPWLDCGTVVLHRRLHGSNTTRAAATIATDYLRMARAAIVRRRASPPHT
jgi:glycosyltransferase involved in cell wall biosynthesis